MASNSDRSSKYSDEDILRRIIQTLSSSNVPLKAKDIAQKAGIGKARSDVNRYLYFLELKKILQKDEKTQWIVSGQVTDEDLVLYGEELGKKPPAKRKGKPQAVARNPFESRTPSSQLRQSPSSINQGPGEEELLYSPTQHPPQPRRGHGTSTVNYGDISQVPYGAKRRQYPSGEQYNPDNQVCPSIQYAQDHSTPPAAREENLTIRTGEIISVHYGAAYGKQPDNFQSANQRQSINSSQPHANTWTAAARHYQSDPELDRQVHVPRPSVSETVRRVADTLTEAAKELKRLAITPVTASAEPAAVKSTNSVPVQSYGDQVDVPDFDMAEVKKNVRSELPETHDGRLLTPSVSCFKDILKTTTKEPIQGGFGNIYICSDVLDIPVVVKEIHCETGSKHKMMSITNEKLGSRTMHFAIVPLLAMAEDSSKSLFYFLTPYLNGGSLYEAVKKDTDILSGTLGDGDPLMTKQIRMKIVYHIASALDYLHTPVNGFRGSIIHMDVKSLNIVLDKYYNARLIDFGLAREMNEKTDQTGITVTVTEVPGSLGYYRTIAYNRLTVKEDFHNFGIVIRELLTGKPPYTQNSVDVMLKDMDPENIKICIQTQIWTDGMSREAYTLNNLATACIDQTVDPSSVKRQIEGLLSFHSEARWKQDEDHDRCDMCMFNKSAPEAKNLLRHARSCRAKMNVCVACMRNSFLNPVICPSCSETLTPMIGNLWGGLLIAGNDEIDKEAAQGMSVDIERVHGVLVSKCPLVMGIPEDSIQVVKPEKPGEPENMMPKIEKAVEILKSKENIHTLVIYFSGHHVPKQGFYLGNSKELLTVPKLQEMMKSVARSFKVQPAVAEDFNETRILIFLDCCQCPNLAYMPKPDSGKFLNIGTSKVEAVQPNLDGTPQTLNGESTHEALPYIQSEGMTAAASGCSAEMPDLTLENVDRCCVLQINACSALKKEGGTAEGSFFCKLFAQALTQRALGEPCCAGTDTTSIGDAPDSFYDLCPFKHQRSNCSCDCCCFQHRDFIFMHDLFGYIDRHMKALKKPRPERNTRQASWNDAMIAYNVETKVALEFRVKKENERENKDSEVIRLKPHLYSKMKDLKEFLFRELMAKKMLNVDTQMQFADCICIEIDRGPKETEELDTINKVTAAWNSRRDLAVSLRKEKNIHRGQVLKIDNVAPAIRKCMERLSGKFERVSSESCVDRFSMKYSSMNQVIEDFADVTNSVIGTLKQHLVNIRQGIKNAKGVKIKETTELHLLFPKPVGETQENFLCFEMKQLEYTSI